MSSRQEKNDMEVWLFLMKLLKPFIHKILTQWHLEMSSSWADNFQLVNMFLTTNSVMA